MKCCECNLGYHLGGCAGIADNTFTTMGVVKRGKWKCRTCRSTSHASSTDGAVGGSQLDQSALLTEVTEISKKLELLFSLKASVDQLLQLPAKVDGLLSLKPTVQSMKDTVDAMQESVQFFSDKYDSLLALVTSHEKEVKALRVEVEVLQSTVNEQAQSVLRLQGDLNDMEQYGRKANLEIHGLPYSPGERLECTLQELAKELNVPGFSLSDVVAIHRLPGKRDSAPPVLVRFVSVPAKEPWMSARVRLRSLPGRLHQIFFNDNLTRVNKELFWRARSRGKAQGYRFIWVKNCKILAKKCEGDPVVKVNCLADLDKIV